MYILAIDTSTKRFSIAILKNKNILAEYVSGKQLRGSEGVIPAVERLLKKCGLTLDKINAFAISKGPGSFTGLRVGYALIKGFCLVKDRPVVTISTLDVMAYNALDITGELCIIQDAKQNKLYTCLYDINKHKSVKKKSKYQIQKIDDLLNGLKGEVHFLGDGITLYKDLILKNEHIKPKFLPEKLWLPKASVVGMLGYEQLKKGKTEKAEKISPMYLYAKDCMVKHR